MKHWVFALSLAVAGVFFVDVCHLVFECGCRSLWAGASTYCNIHNASPPHCPWCAHPIAGGAVAFFATAFAQWAICYRLPKLRPWTRLLLALAAFPCVAGLIGTAQALLWSYE